MADAALVSYLLANRHRITNRSIINCLALAQLNPTPHRRVTAKELIPIFQNNTQGGIRFLMNELRHFGLVDFESGRRGTPGYLIWRVGPEECRGQQANR
jgi:hypothetical protein